jgi:hypothetical protein
LKFEVLSFIIILLVTSMTSASAGFLLGGITASGKVQGLYGRLDKAEWNANAQSLAMENLAQALSSLLASLEAQSGKLLDAEAITRAKSILATNG